MKRDLWTVAAAIGLFFSHLSLQAAELTVRSHLAGEAGFLVNSHLIEGKQEAVLVDAQFTRSEARKVAEMVRKTGKKLTTIFITHAHPDHYFGLEILSREFPGARLLALPEVIEEIRATADGKLAYWKKFYGDDLADAVVVPEPATEDALVLEGQRLPLIKLGPGESAHAAAVYLPSTGGLVAGDLIFNQVHLWLAEDRPEAWVRSLEEVARLGGIRKIYPGHGENGGAELIEANLDYLERFLEVTGQSRSRTEALQQLQRLFPNHRLPVIAELSVQARIPE